MSTAQQYELEPIAKQLPVKQDAFLEIISNAVRDGAHADVVGKMLDHYERFQKMQAKQAFDAAMHNLKMAMPKIIKKRLAKVPTKNGGEFSYPFANLEDCCEVLDPLLVANGFTYKWDSPQGTKDGIFLTCTLKHKDGHSECATIGPAPHDNSGGKNSVQAVGSTVFYLQRYSFCAVIGIAPRGQDNDGAGAQAGPEMEGLEDYCTAIRDAQNFEDMDKAFRQGYSAASGIKSEKAKAALAQAREEWRKRKKAGGQ